MLGHATSACPRFAPVLPVVPTHSVHGAAGSRVSAVKPTAGCFGDQIAARGAEPVYEHLVEKSGWSGLNRRVGLHDRGRAWLERAVAGDREAAAILYDLIQPWADRSTGTHRP
jgi:hypothetical protein